VTIKKLSDEKLVEYVRSKDQEAFVEIVGRYEEKLKRYVGYMIRDDDLVGEVVQGCFVKVFENLNSFDATRKFSSWIYRIAHNEAISEIRGRKRLLYWPLEADFWGWFESKDNLEKELDDKLMAEWLNTCVKDLAEKYRSVLVLYYFEQKSYEEIGEILRISIGTVGTRLSRGKALVKKLCKIRPKMGGKNGK
jgi:RNA polymerase sigma-70 factor (ECF subfamily)